MFTFNLDLSTANTTDLPQCFVVFLDMYIDRSKNHRWSGFFFIYSQFGTHSFPSFRYTASYQSTQCLIWSSITQKVQFYRAVDMEIDFPGLGRWDLMSLLGYWNTSYTCNMWTGFLVTVLSACQTHDSEQSFSRQIPSGAYLTSSGKYLM